MKLRLTEHHPAFRGVFRAIATAFDAARRTRPVAVLWLALLTLGVVGLATGVLPHAWAGMKGSSAAGFLNWWPAQSVRAQGNGGTFTTFEAKDAGTGALQGTFGTSINAAGDIAGVYVTPPNVAHGFVRAAATGAITEFDVSAAGTATNQGTFPASINAGGDIAGMYFDSNNAYHGFVRAGATGTITEFDVPGAPTTSGHRGTIPLSINTAGSITGFYSDSGTVRHGFVRTIVDGTPTFTSFDVPGAGSSATQGTVPLSINAAGDITGCYVDANQVFHGFIRIAATGTITAPINAPGAGTSPSKKGISFSGTVATSIDAGGEITGVYADTNGIHHGFVRAASGTITDPIDAPGAGTAGVLPGTLPASINDSGIITGAYEDASGVTHGFVRAADGTITAPLDAPGASTSGMASGTAALSINATGQMTGTYVDANVVFHGYLFTPSSTPPPAAAPTFNPVAGTYTSPQSVTLADTTPGAVMYYTTDGGTPTPGMAGTNQYAGAIQVSSTETIKAIATATGFSNSSMASATYTINLPTPDFLVTVNPTTLTIVAGQSGMATFTVTPENGFNSQVSFACSGLPSEAACSFNPTALTPNGGALASTLTVTTTAPSAAMPVPTASSQRPNNVLLLTALAMMFAFGIAAQRRRALRGLQFLGLLIFVILASGLSSCGGGSSGGKNPGTPIGTTTASVSASTSGGGAINHAATLTITITH